MSRAPPIDTRSPSCQLTLSRLSFSIVTRLRYLARLWFTFDLPVDRRTYLTHGAALMAFKYGVDAAVIGVTGRVFWTPLDYFSPLLVHREELFSTPLVSGLLLLWTLPFLWIGFSMTLRRALDAGHTPWLALLFFVPLANYVIIATMCVLPTRRGAGLRTVKAVPVIDQRLKSAMLGIAAGVAIVVGMVALSVFALSLYGAALFLGTPFVVGVTSAYIHNRGHPRTAGSTHQVAFLTVALAGGALLLYGIEGLACIAMAAPLALLLAFLGASVGRTLAVRLPTRTPGLTALALLPVLALIESATVSTELREVVTAVEIDAPPESVWREVVTFSELPEPSAILFRLGIAYPVRARIEGEGVGAVRRCEFSTGAFVEPITVWDAPNRLAFDVTAQPPPLQEWSPYKNLHPPHLDGYFRSKRGEFRLLALPGDRTRLEGSTGYELELFPHFYWRLFADAFIHRIHTRVLRHVKAQSEGRI